MEEHGSNGSGGPGEGSNGSGGSNGAHREELSSAIERRQDALTLLTETLRPNPAAILADHMSGGVPLREYLRILHKHRWMILAVTGVMVAVVTVVSFRTRPVYEATSRLEINGEVPDLANLRELFLQLPTSEDFIQTQVRILQGDDLSIQAVRALRLYEKPEFAVRPPGANGTPFTPREEMMLIAGFQSRLQVEAIRNSRLVDVHFESTDPKLAADTANTLADLYVENNFRKKYESTMQATEWMSGQLREVKTKMEQSHEALVKYERDNQIFSLNEGQNVTLTKLGELNHEVTEAEADRIAKESQAQLVDSRRLDDIPAVAQSSLIQDLEKRLADLQDEDVDARATLGPKHPRVLKFERQIAEVKAQLDNEKQQVANRIESEYQAAKRREDLLRKSLDRQKAEANVLNSRLVEYSLLKREYETNQQLYENLLQRLKEAGISSGLRSSNIHVVDRARPPLVPIRPRKTTNILMSLMVGLVLGCLLALFNEYLDNSVKVPEDVEHLVNLPVLGIIPALSSVNGNGQGPRRTLPGITPTAQQSSDLATMSQPQSVVSEAYRALRTSILLSTSKQAPQTILVSSGQPREGKTTTALNLAITLAQRGDRVVLIDTDLRRPRVHRSFGLSNDRGLSSYLAGNSLLDDLPRPIRQIPNLFVITSGPTPPNPAELLSSEPIERLFHELRRQFDFIVMDSPPAITVADSMILAAHADGVMLVVHGGVTTRETLKHTAKMMTSVNARMIGVVLNNVNIRSIDYKYYYTNYYGDYYRHMLEGNSYGFVSEEREADKGVKAKR